MRIDKRLKKDIEKLLLDKEMNIAAADGLFNFCFYSSDNRVDPKHYADEVAEYLDLNLNNDEDKLFFDTRIAPSIKEITEKDYQDNYYRKNINPKPYKGQGYELTYLTVKPYQLLPYDDIEIDDDFIEVSRLGYFKEEFRYLTVIKDDITWMSTDPNEINTMRDSINEASGDVLTFGLGLGYFPIMCAIKPNVSSVTIIEKDPKIIDIFRKHILPLFEFKDKIQFIQADAFNFAKKDLKRYGYLFIDIWHNPEDGLPMYLKFKKILKDKKIKTSYWLEKSILAMYRRCMLTVIEESINGATYKDYLKAKNEYDKIINDLYFKTEKMSFNSIDEIKEILQDKFLQKLV